jgi:hypothetical protein
MTEYTPSQAEGERDDAVPNESGETRPDHGAHSGAESQAHSRTLPGTASAADGYGTQGGTADDKLPAGVEETERPGTSSGPVTPDHVRELLASREDTATLVLLEGRARVIAAAERNTDWYAGAVDVMSGEELARRIGTDHPSDHELDMLAGTLNTMVAQLGA